MKNWKSAFLAPFVAVALVAPGMAQQFTTAAEVKPILDATGLPRDAFTLFSALTREGKEEIWERIEEVLGEPGREDEANPV